MKKWPIVLLVIVALIAGGGYWLYSSQTSPLEGTPYQAPVSAATREQNTAIISVLAAAGMTEAFADATPQRVYVAYELPESADRNDSAVLDSFQQRALGAAAGGAGSAPLAIIVQYVDGTPVTMWKADLAKFAQAREGKMSVDAFLETVEKVAL